MSLNQSEIDKLRMKFGSLMEELGRAELHFLLYKKLSEASKGKEFQEAWGFWNYTITAHAQSALLRLCRVYDNSGMKEQNPSRIPWHLLRLVTEVEDKDAQQQRDTDLEFLQGKKEDERILMPPDRRVVKLRKWRNNVVCHRNQDLVVGGRDSFFKVNGLEENEIQELIQMGFSILKRWACYYKSDYALWTSKIEASIAQEAEGVLPVLESLRQRLNSKDKCIAF